MMHTIERQSFFIFTKNTWIDKLGASFHITNDYAQLYDVTDINELVQEVSGNMSTSKR